MANFEENKKTTQKSLNDSSVAKVRNLVITVAICLLLVVSIITFVTKLIEYNELKEEQSKLAEEIKDYKDSIEELEYWLDAPMNDDYIMKFAREKLDLFLADEIVFTNDNAE